MAVVAFVVFLLLYLTPGDPAAILAGDAATSDDIRRIREKLGLDQPFHVRFGTWIAQLLQGNLAICAPAISQAAGLAAFDEAATAELDGHVARYARNRDLLLRRLPELGITSFAPPDGAFYAYCDVSHLTDDSQRWCAEVLAATGVALAPGVDFDTVDGHRMVRLSFCGPSDQLDEALDRLAAFSTPDAHGST